MTSLPACRRSILLAAIGLLAGCATSEAPKVESPPAASAPPLPPPAPTSARRNAYVLLSGGGTPLSNHYSQYLQARAIAGSLDRGWPAESTWFFFGIGNREGSPPVLADAHREARQGGLVLHSWVPGVLPRNRPATKAEFLRALREQILPVVRSGGTLFLFVGDHGELAGPEKNRESAITMWQLKRGERRDGWSTDTKEVLGVAELRQALAAGLGAGRVVFCMTQCHSGGFHELAVPREMTPPREWFARVPDWAASPATGLRLRAAGYTATDEASPAAGCVADPEPDHWAGYERFFPENLFGLDLMTGQPRGQPVASLAAAHEAAVLVDQTIDKPRSTSEHYLEAWARLIETRLATTLAVTERTQRAVATYQRAVDTGRVTSADPALRLRQAQYARFLERVGEQAPAARTLVTRGTRRELEAAGRPAASAGSRGGRRPASTEARQAWTSTLRPAWKAAVLAGRVAGLAGATLEFERHLLKLEDDGRNLLFGRADGTALLNELYWRSSYAEPARLDRPRAEAMARWAAERRARIVAWGAASPDAAVRGAAEKIGRGPAAPPTAAGRTLSRATAAERVLFHRRVLAAWEFLLAMEARAALAELQVLLELEQTPLG